MKRTYRFGVWHLGKFEFVLASTTPIRRLGFKSAAEANHYRLSMPAYANGAYVTRKFEANSNE